LADKKYLGYAKQVFAGAYFNAGWQGDYLLLAHNCSKKDTEWFRKKGILVRYCANIINQKEFGGDPAVYLSRWYLFQKEFKRWSHIVYLDVDVIIKAPLANLVQTKGFSAVSNIFPRIHWYFKEISFLRNVYPYEKTFASGVFVINTSIINSNSFNAITKLAKKLNPYLKSMGEEGLLNIFFYKKWHKLPNIYNLFVDKNENYWKINPLKVHTIIIHSIGSMKPWDRKSILYDEWQNIAQKADKISLNRRISKKEWSKFKIFFYASFLEIKGFFLRKDIYEWQFDLFYYAVMDIVMLRFPKFFKLLKKTKARIKKFNNV